jgi:hypothetical protein
MPYFPSLQRRFAPVFGLLIGLAVHAIAPQVMAEENKSIPSALQNVITEVDTAANQQNIKTVMQFYSPNFINTDGLNNTGLSKTLTDFWQRYNNINYRTEIKSWKAQGQGFVAETITSINGTQLIEGKQVKLTSTLRSRQIIENGKIVQQEILSERTEIKKGNKAPTVDLLIPEQVRIGQSYNVDAIVKEPLGNEILIGNLSEENVTSTRYLKPKNTQLEYLQAGGLFKIGRAPLKKGNYWISAVLVRQGGMTLITHRLRVVEGRR